jgi:hypothetical protein
MSVLYVVVSMSKVHLIVAVSGHVGPKVIGLSNSLFKQRAVKLDNTARLPAPQAQYLLHVISRELMPAWLQ